MRYLLLSAFIISVLTSCNNDRPKEIQYDIYSSVLEKEFGHFLPDRRYIIGVNDTIKDFKDELVTLIYSVQNNNLFFKEYCEGDSSFKNFILGIKPINTDKEIMDLEKLKSKTKIHINLNRLIKPEALHHTINFSTIVFNKGKDKAILFVIGNSSGSWVLVELINRKWTIRHDILSWAA
jgi:hypothetical protein